MSALGKSVIIYSRIQCVFCRQRWRQRCRCRLIAAIFGMESTIRNESSDEINSHNWFLGFFKSISNQHIKCCWLGVDGPTDEKKRPFHFYCGAHFDNMNEFERKKKREMQMAKHFLYVVVAADPILTMWFTSNYFYFILLSRGQPVDPTKLSMSHHDENGHRLLLLLSSWNHVDFSWIVWYFFFACLAC